MSAKSKEVYVALPNVERGKPVVLGGDPKGKTFTYAHGKTIIVRDIENPLVAYTYNEHTAQTTVAKYAPSGFYIASGDVTGKVRIWDTTQEEHILKYEYRPLGGAIKDIAWSPDSKRLVVCGDGRDQFAHAFLVDTGSAVGSLAGHSRPINSIDFKQARPFRVATAGEDKEVGFFQGPPFKRERLNTEHSNFVNAVRFAPDGSKFVTGGADGRAFLYDGREGTLVAELGGESAPAHAAGIYGVCWSPDGSSIITASADKTVKMWDVANNACTTTFTFGDSVEDQQLGCLWQGDHILSVSLSGFINYLDPANPSTPKRILKGHTKAITAVAVDRDSGLAYSASYDGRVCRYNLADGQAEAFDTSLDCAAQSMCLTGSTLAIAAINDTVRFIDPSTMALGAEAFKTESTPNAISQQGDLAIVACLNHVVLARAGSIVSTTPAPFGAISASLAPSGTECAVGGQDSKIRVYAISGDSLQEKHVLDASGQVTTLAYSPDGAMLASGDTGRNVFVYAAGEGYALKMDRWKFHTAKVSALAWSPDGGCVASTSLDTNVIVWSLTNPTKRITIKGAHPFHDARCIAWADDSTVITGGQDSCLRTFTVTRH